MNTELVVSFCGELPPFFSDGIQEIAPALKLQLSEMGMPVCVKRQNSGLSVRKENGVVSIAWSVPVEFYRALSRLAENWEKEFFEIQETPVFKTGVMLDCSRNGVINVFAFCAILRKMALMGMHVGMLYTEDTYEVPGYPYFGYMRGRYTADELRKLDDYANIFGIELIPCIQTLGHLGRALHWPEMQKYCDMPEVLLADEEETYVLLKQMISSISGAFRSKRIHIGMDEAHGVGLGAHLRKYGFENPHAIIKRHLLRVKEITDSLGLEPIMWSDMFFRLDSPDNEYYDTTPSKNAVESVVPGVNLVYWDYSHESEAEYLAMLDKHRLLMKGSLQSVWFAGAIWAWTGPVPEYEKTIRTATAALTACKKAGVDFALATVWGDNGQESSRCCALPGMQLYAEFSYTGSYDLEQLKTRFQTCCNGNLQQFLELSAFNFLPDMEVCACRPLNMAKYLLYQDPLVQLFLKDMEGFDAASHYVALAKKYHVYAQQEGEYMLQMQFYALLADILSVKCRWHQNIRELVLQKKRDEAKALCDSLLSLVEKLEELRLLWGEIWQADNKPFGFEILDGRMGALQARLKTAAERVTTWAEGDSHESLEEFHEEVLPFGFGYLQKNVQCGVYGVGEIVSACKLDY